MAARVGALERGLVLAALVLSAACGGKSTTPSSPTSPPPTPTPTPSGQLNQATVIDALDYWSSAVGIGYVLINEDALPRLLLRPGTDGLGAASARGLIDGTMPGTNEARSGLVVVLPDFGANCSPASYSCRMVLRHELGHALGYFDHSSFPGLMSGATDVLSDRERRMMVTLYSLPFGAVVRADGSWQVALTGASGQLTDLQAAQDVITYNMGAAGGASYRTVGMICRWQIPVPVYLQR